MVYSCASVFAKLFLFIRVYFFYIWLDELPPHTRDFSRELGGIFLNFTFAYGIISIWIKAFI